MHSAIFLDKDGTLVPDIPYNVNPGLITLYDGVLEGLKQLQRLGYLLVVVSNQPGVAKGYFSLSQLNEVQNKLNRLFGDVHISGYYFCPHCKEGVVDKFAHDCDCRKPRPGLLLHAAKDHNINLKNSWMIGDILNDMEAANSAGCRGVLINNGNETEWVLNEKRQPVFIARNFRQACAHIAGLINV